MRVIFTFIILILITAVNAQTAAPLSLTGYTPPTGLYNHNNLSDSTPHKWFFNKYGGVSTSFVFYNGGHAAVFSAPLGVRLNRRLNTNLYAFSGISVAPVYISNNTFFSADINKANHNNQFWQPGKLGMYASAEAGLMYINDAKTFSISGSISIERSSYPALPYYQVNKAGENPVVYPGR